MGYYEVFFATPDYLVKFWLSLLLAVGAVVGQVVISCMGGFAFAFFDFPGKRLLFGLLCFFMLVPLQVTIQDIDRFPKGSGIGWPRDSQRIPAGSAKGRV